ncbi:hypothetical protein RJ641_008532, partial [Dillenia turbinata]
MYICIYVCVCVYLLTICKNRAASAALNAEVRRTKARLLNEIPKLHGSEEGISKEDLAAWNDLRIKVIPDGTLAAAGGGGGCSVSGINDEIKFNSSDLMAMMKVWILFSDRLDTLKNLAQDMNEELDRQVPLIDKIDTK